MKKTACYIVALALILCLSIIFVISGKAAETIEYLRAVWGTSASGPDFLSDSGPSNDEPGKGIDYIEDKPSESKLNTQSQPPAGALYKPGEIPDAAKSVPEEQANDYIEKQQSVPSIIMDKLAVAQSSGNITLTEAKGYNILGTCVPGKDLYLDGQIVTNVTTEGFFSIYVELKKGGNVFSFSQDGQKTVERKITVKDASAGAAATPTPVAVNQINKEIPYYATVISESAWVYRQNTTTGGSAWQLLKGQKDKIIAETEDGLWAKLSSGQWIEKSNISCAVEKNLINNVLTDGKYIKGENADVIKWKASEYPAVNVSYDGKELTVYFGMQTAVPELELANLGNTVFESVNSGIDTASPFYSFTIKGDAKIEGYYADFSEGEFRLSIKKRKSLSAGEKPLAGFKFVIDAGHGLNDTGALGPMGDAMPEKDINLINAQKLSYRLEQLGAEVIKVRGGDTFYTLYERTEISRTAGPDMFISIHANSMSETTDASDIRGITVWYRNANSLSLAESLIKDLFDINPLTTRRDIPNQSNLYVCRPAWAPSVIIETSFMCNIDDFAWLINDEKQDELAEGIVNAILNYYME